VFVEDYSVNIPTKQKKCTLNAVCCGSLLIHSAEHSQKNHSNIEQKNYTMMSFAREIRLYKEELTDG
jgi:hypothetical protein